MVGIFSDCMTLGPALLYLCESVRQLPVSENHHNSYTSTDIWIKFYIHLFILISSSFAENFFFAKMYSRQSLPFLAILITVLHTCVSSMLKYIRTRCCMEPIL